LRIGVGFLLDVLFVLFLDLLFDSFKFFLRTFSCFVSMIADTPMNLLVVHFIFRLSDSGMLCFYYSGFLPVICIAVRTSLKPFMGLFSSFLFAM
jgi:hypothetical protein